MECALTARFADTGSTNKVGLGFGVAFIFMFPVFYSLFLDATMYLYPSEIFPMIIRSFGISWSISGQWFASTILLGAAPTGFEKCGYKFWFLFIFSCVVYFILVFLYLPEVRNDSLQIALMLMCMTDQRQDAGGDLYSLWGSCGFD